jgi:hypothetical protein
LASAITFTETFISIGVFVSARLFAIIEYNLTSLPDAAACALASLLLSGRMLAISADRCRQPRE